MKVALEANQGWISQNPAAVLEALSTIAAAEGIDPVEFAHSLAKAAGATKAHAHGAEESRFRVLRDCVSEAETLYDTAMTVALGEIVALLEDHLESLDTEEVVRQFGG